MRLGLFSIGVLLVLFVLPTAMAEDAIYVRVEHAGTCIVGVGPFCTILGADGDAEGLDIRFGLILVCGQVGSKNDVDYGSGCNEGGGLTMLMMN